MFGLYEKFLVSKLKSDSAHSGLALTDVERAAIARVGTLTEFDDLITAKHNGWRDAAEYYAVNSSAQFLPRITVPTLVVHALDDPMIPAGPYRAIDWVQLEATPRCAARSRAPVAMWASTSVARSCPGTSGGRCGSSTRPDPDGGRDGDVRPWRPGGREPGTRCGVGLSHTAPPGGSRGRRIRDHRVPRRPARDRRPGRADRPADPAPAARRPAGVPRRALREALPVLEGDDGRGRRSTSRAACSTTSRSTCPSPW